MRKKKKCKFSELTLGQDMHAWPILISLLCLYFGRCLVLNSVCTTGKTGLGLLRQHDSPPAAVVVLPHCYSSHHCLHIGECATALHQIRNATVRVTTKSKNCMETRQ